MKIYREVRTLESKEIPDGSDDAAIKGAAEAMDDTDSGWEELDTSVADYGKLNGDGSADEHFESTAVLADEGDQETD
jgi:hypothetical protein